jgi:hypothetical protein
LSGARPTKSPKLGALRKYNLKFLSQIKSLVVFVQRFVEAVPDQIHKIGTVIAVPKRHIDR